VLRWFYRLLSRKSERDPYIDTLREIYWTRKSDNTSSDASCDVHSSDDRSQEFQNSELSQMSRRNKAFSRRA
jgi:hypothetical protein